MPPHGPAVPEWVYDIDRAWLLRMFDPGAASRGATYARQERVLDLTVHADGSTLSAEVVGTRVYSTVVQHRILSRGAATGPDEVRLTTTCTCPVGSACKHVVAVILTAQEEGRRSQPPLSGRTQPSTVTPTWQGVLDRALARPGRSERDRGPERPLALLVQLELDRPGSAFAAIRLRPLVPGRTGWVRGGISWSDLRYAYPYPPVVEAHREALLPLLTAGSTPYGFDQSTWIRFEELGRSSLRLLTEAAEAGVELLADQQGTPVQISPQPTRVGIDTLREGDGRLRVHASLGVAGFTARPRPLADRTWAVALREPDRLVLAPLDRPLTPGLAELLDLPDGLVIPAEDETRFLASYYPALREVASVVSSDGSVELPTVSGPRLALSVAFEPGHTTRLRWAFRYAVDATPVDVPLLHHPDDPLGRARDDEAEEALLSSLGVLDLAPGLRVASPGRARPGVVLEPVLQGWATALFVRDVLPALRARDDIDLETTGTELTYTEVTEPPVVSVGATDSALAAPGGAEHSTPGTDRDWFDLSLEVTVGGHAVPMATLLAALTRRAERLLLDDGTWFHLDAPELQTLRRLVDEARALEDRDSGRLRINRFQLGLWEELVSLGVVGHQSRRWQESVGALLGLEELPKPAVPDGVLAELRSYQVDGFHWLTVLWQLALGGILADDMGLGKTLQTLALLEHARAGGELTPEAPTLVIAPTSVVGTWAREAERFTPQLRVVPVTQTATRGGTSLPERVAGAHVVVTSYALLRIDADVYTGMPWSIVVLDEAQAVKNHRSKTYQVARRLPARTKLAITGTPLENSLMDLWSLLSIVAPGLFPSPQRFDEMYRRPIESGSSPELLATLRRRVRPLMLRRTKEAVATDLPPKVEQVLSVPLNPAHRRIYDTHLHRERQRLLGLLDDVEHNRIAILSGLTRLRQLSLDVHLVEPDAAATIRSSKVDVLVEHLVELAAEGHRCLVFSQFTRFLAIVRSRLAEAGIDHVYLDGRTRDRARRIAEFTDGDAPAFLISLKAGGSGLTLTEADYVFVLDPWWNPAVEAQAVDRAHRIGQDKTVIVYRLVAEDTVEEKVVALQEHKRDLFARVVDEGELMSGSLSAEDLRSLLG